MALVMRIRITQHFGKFCCGLKPKKKHLLEANELIKQLVPPIQYFTRTDKFLNPIMSFTNHYLVLFRRRGG